MAAWADYHTLAYQGVPLIHHWSRLDFGHTTCCGADLRNDYVQAHVPGTHGRRRYIGPAY